jgi:glycine/D-amino acid oxidase-like deaminating enzyme
VSNPLAVTKAYAARLTRLGGVILSGNAHSLHRADGRWRIDTAEGPIDASEVVIALGPFAPDILDPLGVRLPLGIKRGYHLHFRTGRNATLSRPVVDLENGYCLAPMEQGIRLTTGAEFAARASAAGCAGAVPARRAGRSNALDGVPAVLCGFKTGDRPRARACRPLARLWPWSLGPHAGPRHRAAVGRDDDRRDPVLRSGALRRGAIQAMTARAFSGKVASGFPSENATTQ